MTSPEALPYMAPEVLALAQSGTQRSTSRLVQYVGMTPVSPSHDQTELLYAVAKADVWSAGVLLYEMLTGSTRGVEAADILAAETEGRDWTWMRLPAGTDPIFVPVLRLMLRYDPDARPDCSSLLGHHAFVPVRRLALEADARRPTTLNQLPPRPEGFVGREPELGKLRDLASDAAPGTTVITGMRGMGGGES